GRYGDGALELTSRANVQLRAVRADPAELANRLAAAGLLPSVAHETVRNIAAPPLADPETRDLVQALDRALCADPELAGLPGRFLFAIGQTGLSADVAAVRADRNSTDRNNADRNNADQNNADQNDADRNDADRNSADATPGGEWAVLLAGVDVGVRVTT